jgi:hypothetical protein
MTRSAPPQDAVSVIDQQFQVDPPCTVAVDVPGAVITLRPGSASDRVEVNIAASGVSPSEAESILDRMQVGTHQIKNTVRVSTNEDRSVADWWRWMRTLDVRLHVDLRLPSHVEAEIRAPGGTIDVADLEGHFDLKVMGGTCRADNLDGTLDVRAESSDVHLHGLSGNRLVARVAVGSVHLEDVTTDALTVRSVAAPVTLSDVNSDTTLVANSTSVTLQDLSGPCTAESHAGPLRYVGRPTDETDLSVSGGSLDVELPSDLDADLTMTGPTLSLDEGFSFEGDRDEHEIRGTLNDGGPSLTLRTVAGPADCRAA